MERIGFRGKINRGFLVFLTLTSARVMSACSRSDCLGGIYPDSVTKNTNGEITEVTIGRNAEVDQISSDNWTVSRGIRVYTPEDGVLDSQQGEWMRAVGNAETISQPQTIHASNMVVQPVAPDRIVSCIDSYGNVKIFLNP